MDFEIGRAPHLSDMEEDIQAFILVAAGGGSGTCSKSPAIKHLASPLPRADRSGKRGKFEYGDKLDGPSFTAACKSGRGSTSGGQGKVFQGNRFLSRSTRDLEDLRARVSETVPTSAVYEFFHSRLVP